MALASLWAPSVQKWSLYKNGKKVLRIGKVREKRVWSENIGQWL